MLTPNEEFGLPTIVQIVFDRETERWLVLIPASHYPKTSGMELDLQHLEAMWAGPLQIPSLQLDWQFLHADVLPLTHV